MMAIYKREIRSYMTSMIGYIFIFLILVVTGIYFSAYNLMAAFPVFGGVLQSTTFIFLIAIPVLTMKILAEEKRARTDQLLLTSPVSIWSVVLGKYLAMCTVYLIPMVIISFYPLLLRQYGPASLPMAYTGIFGFTLLGLAYIALGTFISSLTESQIIAAVLSFAALFFCFMTQGLSSFFGKTAMVSLLAFVVLMAVLGLICYVMTKNSFLALLISLSGEIILFVIYLVKADLFTGAIQKFLAVFDVAKYLDNFISGIFDMQGLVYYLSIIIFFLFLSVQSIEKRRWS